MEIKNLIQHIENLRKELEIKFDIDGTFNNELLKISQELDLALNIYYRVIEQQK